MGLSGRVGAAHQAKPSFPCLMAGDVSQVLKRAVTDLRCTAPEFTQCGTFLPLIYFVSLDRSDTILVSADARVEPIYLRFEHRCWHRTLRRGLCHRVCQSPSRRAQPLYYRENRLNSNAVLASSPRRSVRLAGGLRPVSYLPQTKAGHPEGTPFQS